MTIDINNVELNFGIYQGLVNDNETVPSALGNTCISNFGGIECGQHIWAAHLKIHKVKKIPLGFPY